MVQGFSSYSTTHKYLGTQTVRSSVVYNSPKQNNPSVCFSRRENGSIHIKRIELCAKRWVNLKHNVEQKKPDPKTSFIQFHLY